MSGEPPSPRTGHISPAPEPHQRRQVAESFGTDAERYDRARPPYPGALVEAIIAASPGRDVLDVGCGTAGRLADHVSMMARGGRSSGETVVIGRRYSNSACVEAMRSSRPVLG